MRYLLTTMMIFSFVLTNGHGESCIPMELQDAWRLTGIRCDGEESRTFPDSVFASGDIMATVHLACNSGNRVWSSIDQTQLVAIDSISETPGTLNISEGTIFCSGTGSLFQGCGLIGGPKTYHYLQSGDFLDVEVTNFTPYTHPCGSGQDFSFVVFSYERE